MEKGKAVQNKIKLNKLQKRLKEIDESYYYFFLIGFNLGLKIKEITSLNKKELENIIQERESEITRKNKLAEIKKYLESYDKDDYLFSNKEKIYFTLKKVAKEVGIKNFGNETLERSFAYFHYQYFQDIDRTKELFNLISPTATLHYMGYENDRYLCFHCNRGCIYRKKYK